MDPQVRIPDPHQNVRIRNTDTNFEEKQRSFVETHEGKPKVFGVMHEN
jgi:hypothetical protein